MSKIHPPSPEPDFDLIDRMSLKTVEKIESDPKVERLLNVIPYVDAARAALTRGLKKDSEFARTRARGHLRRALAVLDRDES